MSDDLKQLLMPEKCGCGHYLFQHGLDGCLGMVGGSQDEGVLPERCSCQLLSNPYPLTSEGTVAKKRETKQEKWDRESMEQEMEYLRQQESEELERLRAEVPELRQRAEAAEDGMRQFVERSAKERERAEAAEAKLAELEGIEAALEAQAEYDLSASLPAIESLTARAEAAEARLAEVEALEMNHDGACVRLKARVKVLEGALDRYGNHLAWCDMETSSECTCGFTAALTPGRKP